MNHTNDIGFLEIIVGPMFSGKTTHIIELYKTYQDIFDSKIFVVNYSLDKRYHETMLSTHDLKMIPCLFLDKLRDGMELETYQSANVVLINEGQFFDDLYETVELMVTRDKKRVHVCGLDGDFQRKKFGRLLDLIPLCDKVMKMTAKCVECQESAIFSHRITEEQSQLSIGSSNYVALCRSCYDKTNL
jgi:thymidine kinase